LTPGTSSVHPIHQLPSCWVTAVYVLGKFSHLMMKGTTSAFSCLCPRSVAESISESTLCRWAGLSLPPRGILRTPTGFQAAPRRTMSRVAGFALDRCARSWCWIAGSDPRRPPRGDPSGAAFGQSTLAEGDVHVHAEGPCGADCIPRMRVQAQRDCRLPRRPLLNRQQTAQAARRIWHVAALMALQDLTLRLVTLRLRDLRDS